MTHHCNYDRRKGRVFSAWLVSVTVTALLVAAFVIAFLWVSYHSMSKRLCERSNITPAQYAEMKLDCHEYGIDKQ